MFGLIFMWIVLSIFVSIYAKQKDQSAIAALIISLVLSPLIGFLLTLLSKQDEKKIEEKMIKRGKAKKCPYCGELVKPEALVCKHCGKEFPLEG